MSKPQMFNSLLSPKLVKPQAPATSTDKSQVFKFSEPSTSKSQSFPKSQAKPTGHSSALQELSIEISDVYEFRQKCFEKIKSLESTIDRNRVTYESEINYMQEFIKLLKRKLSKHLGSDSIDLTCEECRVKDKEINSLNSEVDEFESALRTAEGQNRVLKTEVLRQKKELEAAYRQINQQNEMQELMEVIAELEETKQANEKLIYELRVENKKQEISSKEKDLELNQVLAGFRSQNEVKLVFKEKLEDLLGKWEGQVTEFVRNFNQLEGKIDKSQGMMQKIQGRVEENLQLKQKLATLERVYQEVSFKESKSKEEVEMVGKSFAEIQEKLVGIKEFEGVEEIKSVESFKSTVFKLVEITKTLQETSSHQKTKIVEMENLETYYKKQQTLLEKTIETHQSTLDFTQSEISQLKDENLRLLKEKTENAQSALSSMEKQNDLQVKLSQVHSEKVENSHQVTSLKVQLDSATLQLSELSQKLSEARSSLHSQQELQQNFEILKERMREKSEELDKMHNLVEKFIKSSAPAAKTDEPVTSAQIDQINSDLAKLLDEKSALKYLDMIQQLLEKLRSVLSTNEDLSLTLEEQKRELKVREESLNEVSQERVKLFRENSDLVELKEKSTVEMIDLQGKVQDQERIIEKLRNLMDGKAKELNKLQDIMQEYISGSQDPHHPPSTSKPATGPQDHDDHFHDEANTRYLSIIKELTGRLKEAAERNDALKADKQELQYHVSQLVKDLQVHSSSSDLQKPKTEFIDLRSESSSSSQTIRVEDQESSSNESQEEENKTFKVKFEGSQDNEENFLASYEEDKQELDESNREGLGRKPDGYKCVSILSPGFNEGVNESKEEALEGKHEAQELSEINASKPRLDILVETNKNLQRQIEFLQDEAKELRQLNEELKEFKGKIDDLTGALEQDRDLNLDLVHSYSPESLDKIHQALADILRENEELKEKLIENGRDHEENIERLNGSTKENHELKTELVNSRNMNKLLEKEIKSLQSEISKNEAEIIQAIETREKLQEHELINENLHKENTKLAALIQESEAELKQSENSIEVLTVENKDLEKRMQSAEDLKENMFKEIAKLSNIVKKIEKELQEADFFRDLVEECEKILESFQFDSEGSGLDSKVLELLSKNENLELNVSQLAAELQAAEDEIKNLDSVVEQSKALDRKNQVLEDEVNHLNESIKKISSELHGENTIKDELLRSLIEKRKVEAEGQELALKLESVEKQLRDLQLRDGLIEQKEAEIESLNEKIQDLEKCLEAFEATKEKLAQEVSENHNLTEEKQDLLGKISGFISEIREDTEKIKNIEQENQELKGRNLKQSSQIEDLNSEIVELEKLKPIIESNQDEISLITSELQDLQIKLSSSNQELEKLNELIVDLGSKLENMQKEKNLLNQHKKVFELSEMNLKEKLSKASEDIESLENQLKSLKDFPRLCESQKQQIENLIDEAKDLTKDKIDLQEILVSQNQQLKKLQDLVQSIEPLELNLERLSEELKVSKASKDSLSKTLSELESTNFELESQLSSFESKLRQSSQENLDLNEENLILQQKLESCQDSLRNVQDLNQVLLKDQNDKKQLESILQSLLNASQITESKTKELEQKFKEKVLEERILREKNQDLVKENKELEETEGQLIEEIQKLVEKEKESSDIIENLKENLGLSQLENTELARKLELMEENNQVLDSLNSQVDELKAQNNELNGKVDDLIGNVDDLIGKNEQLEENYNKILENYETLAYEKESLMNENEKILAELEEMIQKLNKNHDLSGVVENLKSLNNVLENENKDLNEGLLRSEAENRQLKAEQERVYKAYEGLQNENSKLAGLLESSLTNSPRLSLEISPIKTEVEEGGGKLLGIMQGLMKKCEKLGNKNESLESQLGVAQKMLRDVKGVIFECKEKARNTLKCENKLNESQESVENDEIPGELEGLVEKFIQTIESLNEELRKANKELETLKEQELNKKIKELEEKNKLDDPPEVLDFSFTEHQKPELKQQSKKMPYDSEGEFELDSKSLNMPRKVSGENLGKARPGTKNSPKQVISSRPQVHFEFSESQIPSSKPNRFATNQSDQPPSKTNRLVDPTESSVQGKFAEQAAFPDDFEGDSFTKSEFPNKRMLNFASERPGQAPNEPMGQYIDPKVRSSSEKPGEFYSEKYPSSRYMPADEQVRPSFIDSGRKPRGVYSDFHEDPDRFRTRSYERPLDQNFRPEYYRPERKEADLEYDDPYHRNQGLADGPARNIRLGNENRDYPEPRDPLDKRALPGLRDDQDYREQIENRGFRDSRDSRDPRDARDPRDPRDPRDRSYRELNLPKEFRNYPESDYKDYQDSRDARNLRDSRDPQAFADPRDLRGAVKDPRIQPARNPIDYRDEKDSRNPIDPRYPQDHLYRDFQDPVHKNDSRPYPDQRELTDLNYPKYQRNPVHQDPRDPKDQKFVGPRESNEYFNPRYQNDPRNPTESHRAADIRDPFAQYPHSESIRPSAPNLNNTYPGSQYPSNPGRFGRPEGLQDQKYNNYNWNPQDNKEMPPEPVRTQGPKSNNAEANTDRPFGNSGFDTARSYPEPSGYGRPEDYRYNPSKYETLGRPQESFNYDRKFEKPAADYPVYDPNRYSSEYMKNPSTHSKDYPSYTRDPANYPGSSNFEKDAMRNQREPQNYPEDPLFYSKDSQNYPKTQSSYPDDPQKYAKDLPNYSKDPQNYAKDPQNYAKDPQNYAKDPQNYSKDPQNYSKDPQHYQKDPQDYAKDPQNYQKDPKNYAREPQNYSKDPQNYAREPQNYSKDPQNYSREPQNYSKDPQNYSKDPQNYARDPQNYSRDPQNYSNDPQIYSKDPQIYSKDPQNYAKDPQNLPKLPQNYQREPEYLPAPSHPSDHNQSIPQEAISITEKPNPTNLARSDSFTAPEPGQFLQTFQESPESPQTIEISLEVPLPDEFTPSKSLLQSARPEAPSQLPLTLSPTPSPSLNLNLNPISSAALPDQLKSPEYIFSTYPQDEATERLIQQNSLLSSSLHETLEKIDQQQRCIEELLEKLKEPHKPFDTVDNPDLAELLSKIKYQADLISELENKNAELEGRFNRIRVKNNQLESQTKKYSENVEKVFKDVNKKLQVIEKSLAGKEEKVKSIYNDYVKFKQRYITGFQEKSKALLKFILDPRNEEMKSDLMRSDLDKDDLIKLLKERVEYLQDKIDALVKSNYVTKELIENISDKAHDAIEMIKID